MSDRERVSWVGESSSARPAAAQDERGTLIDLKAARNAHGMLGPVTLNASRIFFYRRGY